MLYEFSALMFLFSGYMFQKNMTYMSHILYCLCFVRVRELNENVTFCIKLPRHQSQTNTSCL